ncbi:MAG: FAD-dependent oxidoreductase [Chloroflexi bacterium]|nr:FAD-dependent oxidoreductase [Chloroflexota bacterium]
MPHYKYLIIGGGMTADAAVRGVRKIDPEGTIGLISKESQPPYNRPPLSKALWKGKPVDTIWRGTSNLNVELHLRQSAEQINPLEKMVIDREGTRYVYDKLLLATGGKPRRLPFGEDHILYYRTFDDYRRLRDLTEKYNRFAVIGGGFIGSEIAAALRMNGKDVVMLFPEDGICSRNFPKDLSAYVSEYYRQKGVRVMANVMITGVDASDHHLSLITRAGEKIDADSVIAGVGIQPNTELAEGAGIKVDNGILVNEFLQTNLPDIYAAGDVASFYNPYLGTRMRVEHEDNANTMGETAGKNLAGEHIPYNHLPYFYSDLFELGYEAVGELDPRLEIVSDWEEPFQKGVVYFLKDAKVRGVLLWNVWGKVNAARDLIASPGPFRSDELIGRIS